jgi:PST family polysaccharide transporter
MGFKHQVVYGIKWTFASQTLQQICYFLVTVLLARILSPNDFGLMAMVTVSLNFFSMFNGIGISNAFVQKQDIRDTQYQTAFWINIGVGVILVFVFIAVAPFIALFFAHPELVSLLRVASVVFPLVASSLVHQIILTREMNFKFLAIRDLAATIFAGFVGVLCALKGFGVWSLLFQTITYYLVSAVLVWSFSSWHPRFYFSLPDLKGIGHFSIHVTGFSIVGFFARNVDHFLIGRYLGAVPLGYYSLAQKCILSPVQNISRTTGKVIFAAFSRVQLDIDRISRIYLKLIEAISFIAFPIMFGLISVASAFVSSVYGDKWASVALLVKILGMTGLVQSIAIVTNILILSLGKSDMYFRFGLAEGIVVSLAVLIGIPWGIFTIAILYSIGQLLWFAYVHSCVLRTIRIDVRSFLKPLRKNFVGSGAMAISIICLMPVVDINKKYELLLFAGFGCFFYLLFSCFVHLDFLKELFSLFRKRPWFQEEEGNF